MRPVLLFSLCMALRPSQQVLETIKRASRPLICVPSGAGADEYACAFGLVRVLRKLEKKPELAAADGKPAGVIQHLATDDEVMEHLENLREFFIDLDVSKTKIDQLTYQIVDDTLRVSLAPKKGFWNEKDVQTTTSGFRYDLIICMGAPDLESCAQLYADNPDFFYHTPIINIDHTPENEHYGQINVVDVTASACGEVCHDLVEALQPGLMDEEIATAFLTGMIAKTNSFKTHTVSPKTLQTASKLIAHGARREEIVERLYKTRSLSTLRLWGRALARLKADEDTRLVWSLLSWQDFVQAGATEDELTDVINELITTSAHARVVVLLYENAQHAICAIVRVSRPLDAVALCAKFRASGVREQVRLCFPKQNLVSVEQDIIPHLQTQLKK